MFEGKILCSGSLVTHTTVLTAAHCMAGIPEDEYELYDVLLGSDETDEDSISKGVLRKIKYAWSHSEYVNGYHDLALVELDNSVLYEPLYGITMFPICIQKETYQILDHVHYNQFVYGLGYGKRGVFSTAPAKLVKITQETISPAHCESAYQNVPIETSQFNNTRDRFNGMICALNRQNRNKHQVRGDGGGPLLKTSSHDDNVYQVGVYHGRKAGLDYPQIFVSLDDCSNLNFIRYIAFAEDKKSCESKMTC